MFKKCGHMDFQENILNHETKLKWDTINCFVLKILCSKTKQLR